MTHQQKKSATDDTWYNINDFKNHYADKRNQMKKLCYTKHF